MPKQRRLIDEDQLKPFYEGIDDFCLQHLPAPDDSLIWSEKIFADPIEGYCSLDSWEVAIIDTDLFQRLRKLKQLGLAFLVYPTLGYSRFEHTIGVLARFKQVLSNLHENMSRRTGNTINLPTEEQVITTRLALLCHDIGHCLLSHVSEDILETLPGSDSYPSSSQIINVFEQYAGRRIPIAEILSVCILTSVPFIDYLHRIGIPNTSRPHDVDRIAFNAADLIFGLPIKQDPNSLFLAQLMSSGFDIDKLDYMLRESYLSGISLGISLGWLFKKIYISIVPAYQVPSGLQSRISSFPSDTRFAILSLARGGQFAFEEFCVARLALHEKIYLHQKIRAAEVEVKENFKRIVHEIPEYSNLHQWLWLKESLLDHPDAIIPRTSSEQLDLFKGSKQYTVKYFGLDKLWSRKLLGRAYAFGWQNSLADPMLDEKRSEDTGVNSLLKLAILYPDEIISYIREKLSEMKSILSDFESFPNETVQILVDPPRLSTIQQGQDTVYIEYPNQLSLRWMMPIDRIEEYYHMNRALGYIFTEQQYLPYILLAAEKMAWDKRGVVCVQDGLVNSDVVSQSNEIKQLLNRSGFYADSKALQPISHYLSGIQAQTMISVIARKLAIYESRTRKRVSPASVTTFVSQFPPELQDAALNWIQNIRLIRPDEELRKVFNRVNEHHLFSSCQTIGFSPLGAMTDSASRIAYDLRDIGDSLVPGKRVVQAPLAETLASHLDCYIIYDDNTNSGLQALNILATWLGIKLEKPYFLDEEHVQLLSRDLIDELLCKPVAIIFSVSTEQATSILKQRLIELLGFSDNQLLVDTSVLLRENERIFSGSDSPFQHPDKLRLREFLVDVGKNIFLSEKKADEEADRRSLGDAKAEAMIVFPYNCPTMTIPALWISGKYHDADWEPLIERGRRWDPNGEKLIGEDA